MRRFTGPLGTEIVNVAGAKEQWGFKCACGTVFSRRIQDMLRGTGKCQSCAASISQKREAQTAAGQARLHAATEKAATANRQRRRDWLAEELPGVSTEGWDNALARARAAKGRCTNPNLSSWPDYGGRGVQFRFARPRDMAHYMLRTFGLPPLDFEVDRVNNNGHYEAGNLRWASIQEQANNKRPYRGAVYGPLLRRLRNARPDYTYEGLRRLVNLGWSEERIVNHVKGSHVRHT